MISLARIALVDCEASSLAPESFPIEVGWCLPDTISVGSVLIAPEPSWDDWDLAAEAIHGISREQLVDAGVPAPEAVERFSQATAHRTLYADGSKDGFWLGRMFGAVGLAPPRVEAFDVLLDRLIRPDADPRSPPVDRNLARAERQGRIIDQAYARAQEVAPRMHRAAADARHLCAVLREALMLMSRS